MVAIGRQLAADGWTVVMLTGKRFRGRTEQFGLKHVSIPESCDFDDRQLDVEFPARARMPGVLRSRYDLEHLFAAKMVDQFHAVSRLIDEHNIDVVLAENLFLGLLPLLSTRTGRRPRVGSVCTSPLMVNSQDTGPFGPGFAPSTTRWGMARNRVLTFGAKHVVLRHAQRIAEAAVHECVGESAGSFLLDWPLLADDIFVLTTPAFEYPRRDLADRLDFVGPVLEPFGAQHESPTWWSRVTGPTPVVVVTQGTLDNGDLGKLVEPTLTGMAGTDTVVVATTGNKPASTIRTRTDNSIVTEFVPFNLMLPQADVLVTNGGWGGVHFALRHGVPMVVAGTTEDKNEVAARIVRSGCGIRLRSTRPAAIRRAVQTVLDDPRYRQRARELGEEIARLDGPANISKALARPPKSVSRSVG
jgi:UDP:flavonoid glycosyltransferase YjiC (YdhE family)